MELSAEVGDPTGAIEMKPQDYSARTKYRPPAGWYRRLNRLPRGIRAVADHYPVFRVICTS